MEILEAITQRRSIRRFKDAPVTDEQIREIYARYPGPSAERQPWRFVVVRGEKRAEMIAIIRAAWTGSRRSASTCAAAGGRCTSWKQAPATILVFNEGLILEDSEKTMTAREVILASVEHAVDRGGDREPAPRRPRQRSRTLWIADVFYAYEELCSWLGEAHQ